MGAGLGMVVRAGATTGDTRHGLMIVHAHLSMFTLPMVLFTIDGIVVVVAALNFGVQAGFVRVGRGVRFDQDDGFRHQGLQHGDAVLIISPNQGDRPSDSRRWIAAAPGWKATGTYEGAKPRCCASPGWRPPA